MVLSGKIYQTNICVGKLSGSAGLNLGAFSNLNYNLCTNKRHTENKSTLKVRLAKLLQVHITNVVDNDLLIPLLLSTDMQVRWSNQHLIFKYL